MEALPGRIKLTYLITDLKVGGVPLHLYRLATRLPRDRFDIQVVSLADEGPVGRQLVEAGISVSACGATSALDARALLRLWGLLHADPPQVLHAMLFHANMAARLIGPMARVPTARIICEIQTVEIERRWHLPVDGLTCRLCRFEVGNSPSVVEHLHRCAHIPRTRLRCEWGAVDGAAIAAATPLDRASLGVAPGERLLLWTGRLDPVKGFEELLEGCRLLTSRYRIKLLLAGEGPYRPTIERLVRELGLELCVSILGHRADIPRLLRTADVFVFTSRTEGLPNSLLEAMAAGLPVVATNVPGCRDLVKHEQTGLLVHSGSPEGIAEGVAALLDDRALSVQLGQSAADWVRGQMDGHAWVERWERIYHHVSESKPCEKERFRVASG